MSSSSSLQCGLFYHIYNRGNNRENIFLQERNYPYFLDLYSRHIDPIADTYVFCLLKNHFHLLVRIKTQEEQAFGTGPEDPSRRFGIFFNAYAKAINKTYSRSGALFQRPFRRIEVSSAAYLCSLVAYIHQNPQKHGFVDDFRDWPHSSYPLILSAASPRIRYEQVIGWYGD